VVVIFNSQKDEFCVSLDNRVKSKVGAKRRSTKECLGIVYLISWELFKMGVIDDFKKVIIFFISDATYHYYPNYPFEGKKDNLDKLHPKSIL
jgi:hypothetical protein